VCASRRRNRKSGTRSPKKSKGAARANENESKTLLGKILNPKGVVVTVVALLVGWAAFQYKDSILNELVPKDKVTDSIRQSGGQPGIKLNGVDRARLSDEKYVFACADDCRLSREEKAYLNDSSTGNPYTLDELEDRNTPVNFATWKLLIQGNRAEVVQVLDVIPVDVTHPPTPSRTLFYLPAQGGGQNTIMGINFDDLAPKARIFEIPGYTFSQPYFSVNHIDLQDRETNTITFRAFTTKYTVRFKLDIQYQVGGAKGDLIVDNNGKEFEVAGYSCSSGKQLSYQSVYLYNRDAHRIEPGSPADVGNPC